MPNSEVELLRAVIDATADGILVVDTSGEVQFSNQRFRDMWAVPAELCGADDACLLEYVKTQLADPESFLARVAEIYGTPREASFDVLQFADGRVFERYSNPYLMGDDVVGRVWSFRNVSKRRRAEREAFEAQRRFQSLTKATSDVVYDWNIQSGSLWWSDSFYQGFGYERDAVEPNVTWWLERLHVEDRTRVEQGVHAAVTGSANTWAGEYRFMRADGSFATVFDRCYFERDDNGWATRCIGAIMDMSERKQSDERLARLAAILESTTDFVGTADFEGRLQYLNKAARRLAGISDDADVSQLQFADFHAGWAQNDVVRAGIAHAITHGSWSGDSVIRRHDGREVPISHVILAHRGANGEVEYLSTIARDMSGERSLQQQLLQSQKMEAVGQLAGGIAHDFNNLLTVIKAHCEFLSEDISVGHPLRPDVEAVSMAGDRASALTRQLLAFSRQQFLKPVALNLNDVVKGVEPMLRRLIGEDIVFTTVCRDHIGVVQADPRQIEQVLINLAVNARDAMPRGGALTVATDSVWLTERDEETRHGAMAPGEYVELVVSDTGTGMTERVREKIFEPFYTTKEQGKGTGLGLSTAYGIVKQSGGHISVLTEEGAGSTFTVYLPRTSLIAESIAPAPLPARESGTGSILLVEDESSLREAARRSLERFGYTVITAVDGRDALRVANQTSRIDLLVTDVVMPNLGGRELAELLRVERPGLAVLFMSGYTDDDILRRGLLARDATLLEKPFTPNTLAAAVRNAIVK